MEGQIIIQNENLGVPHRKAAGNHKAKNIKTTAKKGTALGSRKALIDITNKSTSRLEASSRKKSLTKEEINFAGEALLHDHKKCIESNKAALGPRFILETILPGHDSVFAAEHKITKKAKSDPDSPRGYPEPVELPASEFSDWLKASAQKDSPQGSPICWDSPPGSPCAWQQLKPVEFALKPETDA